MQVSWIDPAEIARLAAQLEGPLQREETGSWDLETLPNLSGEPPPREDDHRELSQLADAMAAPLPAAMEAQGSATPPEVAHVREKLRAIRDRAREAGLLPPATTVAVAIPDVSTLNPPQAEPIAIPAADEPPVHDFAPAPTAVAPPAAPTPFLPLEGSLRERLQSFMPWAQNLAQCEEIILADDHGELLWGHPEQTQLALPALLAAGAGLRSGMDAATQTSVFIRTRVQDNKVLSVLPCSTRYGMVTLALLNAPDLPPEAAACLREALLLCIEGKNPGSDSIT